MPVLRLYLISSTRSSEDVSVFGYHLRPILMVSSVNVNIECSMFMLAHDSRPYMGRFFNTT
jgi:hypothetical protein